MKKNKRHIQRYQYKDYGQEPFIVDIDELAKLNNNFRVALWSGTYLQVTLMSIDVGSDIGLEKHDNLEQFIKIVQGKALVQMGDKKDKFTKEQYINSGYAIIVPSETWHNITNVGGVPLKIYSVYAPPKHPFGTVQPTKADASEH